MDPIALVVIGVVVAGVAWWMLSSKDDTPEAPPAKPKPTPPKTPGKLRSKAPAKTLPSESALNNLTKANLEDLGREHGLELDKRKTKANMIADLKAGVKK